jgi:hypothetical protein
VAVIQSLGGVAGEKKPHEVGEVGEVQTSNRVHGGDKSCGGALLDSSTEVDAWHNPMQHQRYS